MFSLFLTRVCVLLGVTSLRAELTSVTANLSNHQGNEGLKNKSLNFVDLIKNNLRRNNDDYIAVDLHGAKLSHEGETRRLLNDTEETAPVLDHPAVANKSADSESTVFVNLPVKQIPEKSPDIMPVPRASKIKHNEKGSMHKSPINDKDIKSRVDDWKRVVDKNKRLRMYTSTPKIEPSPPVTVKVMTVRHTPGSSRNLKELTKAARARPLHAFRPLRTPGVKRAPPNADQLDMAPARGAYIHDLRVKGLFCHRNVLWPEGPKYDSKGNILMPAFNPKLAAHRGKTFIETTTALFILPRCCNCCRKSVLGCQ